ncbi:type IV pilin protein [Shewanella algidipiscicola]|uniref:Type IV minor pilin protein PilE n=1 Tax=Shewanella algidipiscicola TaxID=614070 RepID=A0ABQ4PJK0_9GAMM|nr:type IV pilin protein [Shewanella algidipiscicola]GIU47909.1 type IV minor pilin protein PilE [Shewanella algidipiscicola]
MQKVNGFTLIELMITVAIVGILASIAYPSYIDYITKSGRSEGVAAVMRVANLQEQYYLDNRAYATDMAKLGLANPFVTEHGHYSVASVGTSSFTITATAQGSQASRDSTCKTITMTSAGVKGPSTECWK